MKKTGTRLQHKRRILEKKYGAQHEAVKKVDRLIRERASKNYKPKLSIRY